MTYWHAPVVPASPPRLQAATERAIATELTRCILGGRGPARPELEHPIRHYFDVADRHQLPSLESWQEQTLAHAFGTRTEGPQP